MSLEPAYVIHRRAYSDTSLIVELLTPEHGRVSVLARGVKKGKSQKSLLLQPFRSLHVSWTGRGELPVLNAAEEAGKTIRLQGEALACGYYVNELVYHLVPKHEPAPDLFTHYWPTIESCCHAESMQRALRHFEVVLLEQLGLSPTLDHDVISGKPTDPDSIYFYRIPEGPIVSDSAKGNGVEVSGATLLKIVAMDFSDPQVQNEAKRLTRALLHYHLDGKPLLSRALFKSFSSLGAVDSDQSTKDSMITELKSDD